MKNSDIRDVNPTTKRLVERCLGGDWCVHLRRARPVLEEGRGSPTSESSAMSPSHPDFTGTSSVQLARANSKTMKSARSAENLKARPKPLRPARSPMGNARRSNSGNGIADSSVPDQIHPILPPKRKGTAGSMKVEGPYADRHHQHPHTESEFHHHRDSPIASSSAKAGLTTQPDGKSLSETPPPVSPPQRRSAPPPPLNRRKPPAVPMTNGGAMFQTIRTSATSPLARVTTKSLNT